MTRSDQPILLVMSVSGAGRSSVLNALEDMGYRTIDNLPLALVPAFWDNKKMLQRGPHALALEMPISSVEAEQALTLWQQLKKEHPTAQLIFLESEDGALKRRYRETRRTHPFMAPGRTLEEAIDVERDLLCPFQDVADHVLDTSLLTPIELRTLVRHLFGFKGQRSFWVDVMSFAFGKGVPREANLVFDMRFLKNPHYQPALRDMTGQHAGVQQYLESFPTFQAFNTHMCGLLSTCLPAVKAEGRGLFVLAFGCTGGRHRSVAMAENCYAWLRDQSIDAEIYHRELIR